MILRQNIVQFLSVGLLIILPIYQASAKNLYNYNSQSIQDPGYRNKLPGFNESCYGGCEKGLICSKKKCICPTDYVFSPELNECVHCPLPWMLVKDSCIQYFDNKSPLTWKEARNKCNSISAELMDVNYETFFENAECLIDLLVKDSNHPLFYVGVEAENPFSSSYISVLSKNRIPAFSNLWNCNTKNNYICSCNEINQIFNDEKICGHIENLLGFNNENKCKRCTFASFSRPSINNIPEPNETLQLYPVDCESPELNITNYICQKPNQYSKNTNNYLTNPSDNNYRRNNYYDRKCNAQPTFVTDQKCNSNSDCQNGLICYNQYCGCSFGYHLINNTVCKRCPVGWIHYDGHCYFVSTEKLNWTASLLTCYSLSNQSNLIDIDSYPMYPSRLFRFLRCIGSNDNYWIGAYKNPKDGNWMKFNNTDLISLKPHKPWYEYSRYLCDEESSNNFNLKHGSDVVMKANGKNQIIASGNLNEENKFICESRLDQQNELADLTNIYSKIKSDLSIICNTFPCLNNGKCYVNNMGEPVCNCSLGFNGTNCQYSACDNFSCLNNGTCHVSIDGLPICDCPLGLIENCDIECGLSSVEQNLRIVGGIEAANHSWPAQVLIVQSLDCFTCAGTLIDRTTVITAAQCLSYWFPNSGINFTIYLGLHEADLFNITNSDNLPNVQKIDVSRITIHPNFDFLSGLNDIAILKLSTPAELNQYVQPACLPNVQSNSYPAANQSSYAIGWGSTKFCGLPSNVLRNVKLTVYDGSTFCSNYGGADWSTQVCAGEYDGGKSACQGDGGGGLYVNDTINGVSKYILSGIASYGYICAFPRYPSVFTRVSAYLDWIKANK